MNIDPTGESATVVILGIAFIGMAIDTLGSSGRQRANTMLKSPSVYNVGNWLTMGAFDTVKGAVMPKKPFSAQHWIDSAATASMVLPGISAVSKGTGSLISKIKAPPPNPGVPFKTGQRIGTIQYGVDPNTLIPKKNLKTLDPNRIKSAVKYAGDQALEVSRNGYIQQGHHRAADAIAHGRAVDVEITILGD